VNVLLSVPGFHLHALTTESIRHRFGIWLSAAITFAGCWFSSFVLHEPVPRIHDEFSYILMGETLAHVHTANPSPPLPEFFDSFHVLIRPAYVSKYFPAQGVFLALGEKLAGHPAIGVWLSSALACAALVWMLQAWVSPGWALLGGFIVVVQYGVYSYWSQTYWGGMVAMLGGALFFGALRRLWEHFSWQGSIWLALGLVILANSRPLEGVLTVLPGTVLFLYRIVKNRRWSEAGFWPKLVLPCLAILALGALATGSYNHAITGSALTPPYVLHEQQYQESPPFIFMPQRPQLTYTSVWLRYYYEFQEFNTYKMQRSPLAWALAAARKIATWWDFYCGVLLSIPLFLPGVLKSGRARIAQAVFLVGFLILPFISDHKVAWRIVIDLLALLEAGVLWFVFDGFWSRLAIGTSALVLLEVLFTKWPFPHYFAPAACLVWYLQTEGLRRIWEWRPQSEPDRPLTRAERRGIAREKESKPKRTLNLRASVYALPVLCVISLVLRVEGRLNGWKDDPHGPDRATLLLNDWSVRRAELDHWLEQQTTPQLVFVKYSRWHNVNDEWVYNHADIMQSHVIWARDLGADHNKLLLNRLSDRTAWLLEADAREPQLVPYAEAESRPASPTQAIPGGTGTNAEQDEQTNW
jgi:hypothetical protein